jgi:uncharacterized membrane protein YcjF (UPF0283 family)
VSDPTRTSGRIDEEAIPADGSASPFDSQYLSAEDKSGSAASKRVEERKPGPVEDPTEPMPDEQVIAQPFETTGPGLVKRSPWRAVFWVLSINIFIWLFYEAVSGILGAWRQSIWLGLPLAILACVLVVVLVRAGRREYKALKVADALAERRNRMRDALATNNLTVLRDTLEPTLKNLRRRHPGLMTEFEEAAKYRETASEYLKQFENIVLTHLDQEVSTAINHSAIGGGVVVALIPHPAFDAAVALWRATALVRKIGEIYGLEPTGLSSVRLLKHSIATAIIAASAGIAADLLLEQVTTGVVEKTLSMGTEALVTAKRLYSLGNLTQKLCRPMVIIQKNG